MNKNCVALANTQFVHQNLQQLGFTQRRSERIPHLSSHARECSRTSLAEDSLGDLFQLHRLTFLKRSEYWLSSTILILTGTLNLCSLLRQCSFICATNSRSGSPPLLAGVIFAHTISPVIAFFSA